MLISRHDCFSILYSMQENGIDVTEDIQSLVKTNEIPKSVIDESIKRGNNNVINFYLNLNKKAHKIIKEILTCEGKPVGTYLKIATSIITQGVIAMEHLFKDTNDITSQNDFIECLGLSKLSSALSLYFNTGNYSGLIEAVNNNKKDVKLILD